MTCSTRRSLDCSWMQA